jgi:beta-lactamase regulating signal transducer with metallopeptidase domain
MSDALFPLLLGTALRSTVILIVALAAARLLVRRTAALRHAIFTAAVAGVVVVPAITALLPGIQAPFVAHALSSGLEWLQRPIRSLRETPVIGRAGRPATGSSVVDEISLESPTETSPVSPGALLLTMLWGAGVLIVAGRTAVRAIRAARLTSRARVVEDQSVRAIAREIAKRQGRAAPPPIFETAELSAPATVGTIWPAVLLPVARSWSHEHTRYVLAHELAHAARRDCLTRTLAQIACAVHWFNPLIWVVERRMALERERACDDLALAEGAQPEGYAMLLLDVARVTRAHALPPAAMMAMAQPSELETRLLSILDPTRDRGEVSARGRRVLATIAASIIALSGALRLDAAPVMPNVRAVVHNVGAVVPNVSAVVPQEPTTRQARHVEPDTRKDSVADPTSERVARVSLELARRRGRSALTGPDSALARTLLLGLGRDPRGREDLVRERAAWALSQTRGTRLIEPLLAALDDKDWRIRAYAAWSLGLARDPRAVPPLIAQMGHPVWRMRAMAAHALADMADERARVVMTAALGDEAWQVRVSGAHYLSHFGDADARTRLRAALRDSHVAVRMAATDALAP